jgi:DNA-directed RNA polymerase specialized sigma subunit
LPSPEVVEKAERHEPLTQKETAEYIGISTTRVQQIEEAALKKMRDNFFEGDETC